MAFKMNESRPALEGVIPHVPPLISSPKTGEERFHSGGQELPFNLLRFWQWSASDLASNTLRGRLAEFLVGNALGITDGVRAEWDPYDLRTKDGVTVEVKSAAYLQSWHQRRPSIILFNIGPTRFWDAAANSYHSIVQRQAQVYVFALLNHQDKTTLDPLNVDQWRFHVLPTRMLNERFPSQKQVRLSRLLEIGAVACQYHELSDIVHSATQF